MTNRQDRLRARLRNLGPAQEFEKVQDGVERRVVLHLRKALRPISAAQVLIKRHLPLMDAKRTIEELIERGWTTVTLPKVEDWLTLVNEAEDVGLIIRQFAGSWERKYPIPFSEWQIGMEFVIGEDSNELWRVTDIGTRTLVAIQLNHPEDPSWYNGPPYAVVEHVMDEYDLEVCYPVSK